MGRFPFPDLRPLIWLAAFGLICAVLLIFAGGGWMAYHLYQALALYLGATQ